MRSLKRASRFGTKERTRPTSLERRSSMKRLVSEPPASDENVAEKRGGMTAIEYREFARWAKLEPDQLARLLQQGQRTVRRQLDGESRIPGAVAIVVRLHRKGKISLSDIMSALRG